MKLLLCNLTVVQEVLRRVPKYIPMAKGFQILTELISQSINKLIVWVPKRRQIVQSNISV